jgi:hypothetical protein
MPKTSSKDLATIYALEMSNALQNPAPVAPFSHIGTAQLQALRQLSDIFTRALPPPTTPHAPPTSQALSHFRNTIPPAPVLVLGSPRQAPSYLAIPHQSPRLARYPSPRVIPGKAPSPRVAPRVNPMDVASPRMNPTLQHNSVIPLTPHPEAANAPYVPQGMVVVNLFDTFEEEHMVTPTLARYNTGPGHNNTLQTTLNIILRVFSAHLHSHTPSSIMHSPSKPVTTSLWPMLSSTRTLEQV